MAFLKLKFQNTFYDFPIQVVLVSRQGHYMNFSQLSIYLKSYQRDIIRGSFAGHSRVIRESFAT